MKKQLNAYCRRVRRCLPCPGKLKKQIMDSIWTQINLFLEKNPTADMTAIQQHFGTPQQIAAAYIDEMTPAEILRKFKIKRTVITIVCAAAALALLLWAGTLAAALLDLHDTTNGTYDIFITEE